MTIRKMPIGIQDFASLIEDGYIYVDKTALIYKLVKEGKLNLAFNLNPNELRYFEIKKIKRTPDTGYDYEAVIAQKCVPDENQA